MLLHAGSQSSRQKARSALDGIFVQGTTGIQKGWTELFPEK
jgi:hypothetical protein